MRTFVCYDNHTSKKEAHVVVKPYLKERLMPGSRLTGTHIVMTDSICSEAVGRLGFDFVLLDAENTENSYTSLRNHLTALNAGGTPALVRVSANLPAHTCRVLELGPDGIVIPGINTASDAKRVMSMCLLPPDGQRRMSPLRAAGYGLKNISDFVCRDCHMMCRLVELDTAESLRNLGEIIKVRGIDGFIFDPGNATSDDGTPDNIFGGETLTLIREAAELLRKSKKPFGVSVYRPGEHVLTFWRELGADIFASGTDIGYILAGAGENLESLKATPHNSRQKP